PKSPQSENAQSTNMPILWYSTHSRTSKTLHATGITLLDNVRVECNVFDVGAKLSDTYPTITFAMLTPLWG
ncbi:MAG: hypothetical protein RRY02_08640, partial [Muribaculaceae bacterium]